MTGDTLTLLTEKSLKISEPDTVTIPLLRHQRAMLYKCLQIEKNSDKVPYGILGDKAGTGKTAVLLSLLALEKYALKKVSNTMIVVPSNIFTQWQTEISKFIKQEYLTVFPINSFVDLNKITKVPDLNYKSSILYNMQKFDIFLTTPQFYSQFCDILVSNGIHLTRAIFDEIDTTFDVVDSLLKTSRQMHKSRINSKVESLYIEELNKCNSFLTKEDKERIRERIKSQVTSEDAGVIPVKKIIWFVSASYESLFDNKKFSFNTVKINMEIIEKNICKCSQDFIDISFNLKPYTVKDIICDSVIDKLDKYLPIEALDAVNSYALKSLVNKDIKTRNIEKCGKFISDYIRYSHLKKYEELSEKVNDPFYSSDVEFIKNDMEYNESLADMIYKGIGGPSLDSSVVDKFEYSCKYLEDLDSSTNNLKLDNLLKVLNDNNAKKNIIFSDFDNSFDYLEPYLDDEKVKYINLTLNSDPVSISKKIEEYRNTTEGVTLLVNGITCGCGMNLEMTDNIIFLHKTTDTLREQLIGRAYRYGRNPNSQLVVYNLFNRNEML